jgi:hypothetical protein
METPGQAGGAVAGLDGSSGGQQPSNPRTTMLFKNGEKCFNGPARSAKVTVSCGATDNVTWVTEPGHCMYAMHLETPAACLEVRTLWTHPPAALS